MDLWSFIPYYMAHLYTALRGEAVEATLGTVRYHLDREYFRNAGLTPDPWLLDISGKIRSRTLRRLLKSCEYVFNLSVLGIRLAISRPDVLHVQYFPFLERGFSFEIWFLKLVRRLGIRVVYTVHNVTRQDEPEKGIPLFRRAYNTADVLICHGEGAKAELMQIMEIPAEKITVIPHGPLFEKRPGLSQREAREELGLSHDEPLVLSAGVISEYKGIPFLLDAWKKLKQQGIAGRLLVAGTGDERVLAEIREKVLRENLSDSVILRLEFIPVVELPLLYEAADILVYPYKAGTTSGALLTGLNYNKAVVATKLPFFQEYLRDQENALLVEYAATEELASALRMLIQQPELRSKPSSTLKFRASQDIQWKEIVLKTRECYEATALKGQR